MAPRTGQLDEISEKIGELKGSFAAIERYMHEREHGLNNLSQKIDAMRVGLGKDIAAVEAKFDVQFKAMNDRIAALEATDLRQAGARNVVVWFLQSPLVGWIAAAVTLAVAWWKKP